MDSILKNGLPHFTRWWWYGAAATKEGIKKQLQLMHDAGIGGVEIQVIYPLLPDDPQSGRINLPFYSPEFFEALNFTLDEAEKLGMQVDFTLGSGWPFGGPFVTADMAPDILIPFIYDITGPSVFEQNLINKLPGDAIAAVLCKREGDQLKAMQDVSDELGMIDLFGWPWGQCVKALEIPEGPHRLVLFVSARHRQVVGIPSRGAEGFAIDHFRKDICDSYFDSMMKPLAAFVGTERFRSFFCDSIELFGNNFTPILPEEFQKRRGYNIKPHLPALWYDCGEETGYIRNDFFCTMSELMLESFFNNFTEKSNQFKTKSRVQAHGVMSDILKTYGSADIPEGETFGNFDHFEVNIVHRRIASSAGLVYNRSLVSNETFTWLRSPRALVTLEMMKRAVDAVFLDGINHIVNHGYAYTPEDVDFQGLPFYASSNISHSNTWWKYYKHLASYINRSCAILQYGHTVSDLAVYLPQNDIWHREQISELHMSLELSNYMDASSLDQLHKSGWWFTFVNDQALTDFAQFDSKGMRIGNGLNHYKAIVLPKVTVMSLALLEALTKFVKNGGLVFAVGKIPHKSDTLCNRESIEKTLHEAPLWQMPGFIYIDDMCNLPQELKKHLDPDCLIKGGEGQVNFIHKKNAENDFYFIANTRANSADVEICIKQSEVFLKHAKIYDALNDQFYALEGSFADDYCHFSLHMEANESFFITNFPVDVIEKRKQPFKQEFYEITNWTFSANGITKKMPLAQTWENIPGLEDYCGEGLYQSSFVLTELPEQVELHFESLHSAASIYLNDQYIGDIWKKPFSIDISSSLQLGENKIKVFVSNTWINRYLNPENDHALLPEDHLSEWPYFPGSINHYRQERLNGEKERIAVQVPQASGLSGKVCLKTNQNA